MDPNEKFGASGYGPQEFVQGETTIPYRINFENLGPGTVPAPDEPATAPAQRVEVTDQLSADLDFSTLEFTEAGFGDTLIDVPAGRQYHFAVVPMTFNDQTFDVEVELSFDPASGVVRAIFQSINPGTFLPPDVMTGFLPPEDATGRGKGYIGFTVAAGANLPTGTEIRNVALIRFDGQTVIATNQIDPQDASQGTDPAKEALNTIDVGRPTSAVTPLPETTDASLIAVSWSGQDDAGGSGLAAFDVYVSVNGGQYELWLDDTDASSAEFVGQGGNTYAFYTVATDNVGHQEEPPEVPDAQVTVVSAVTGRYVFYNHSTFDGNTPAANEQDDAAIAPDKQALLPGQTASFANYTSYSRGINGIMIDVANLPDGVTLGAADFQFRVGNTGDVGSWTTVEAPQSITVRPADDYTSRITLTWPDNTIQKQWLQVTVLATAATGLVESDVFYFGNAIGESGNSTSDAKVNAFDMLSARDNQRSFLYPAPIDFFWTTTATPGSMPSTC